MAKKRNVILDAPIQFGHDKATQSDKDMMEFESMKLMLMTAMAEMGISPEDMPLFWLMTSRWRSSVSVYCQCLMTSGLVALLVGRSRTHMPCPMPTRNHCV